MEIRELRVGNLVNVPRLGQSPFRIDIIEHLSKNHDKVGVSQPIAEGFPTHPLTLFLEDLQPIPLTEEILLKCGFDKLPYSYLLNRIRITLQDQSDIWWVAFNANSAHVAKIKHLHQLQNLIYTLTGEELKINL